MEWVLLMVATAPARALAAGGRARLACSGVGHRISDRAEPQTRSASTSRFEEGKKERTAGRC